MYHKNDLAILIKKHDSILDFIQEYALDGLWFLDTRDQNGCWINPKLKDILGYKKEAKNILPESLFISILTQVMPFETSRKTEFYDKVLEYYHKDGAKIVMDCRLYNLYDSDGILYGILGANTLKNEIEHHIHEQQAILEATQNSQLFYIVKTDIHGNYIYANDYFYEVFGFEESTILGNSALLSILKEDHSLCIEVVMKCFQYPSVPHKVILRKENQWGKIITSQWEYTGLVNENGDVFEILCQGYNVSEKIKTESDLSVLLANMTDLIISIDTNGSISYVSPNVKNLYGYEPFDFIGKSYLEFVHPEDLALSIKSIETSKATGIPFKNLEIRLLQNPDNWYWVNINASINPVNKETILVITDISEKIESLVQLRRTKLFLQATNAVAKIGGWERNLTTGEGFISDYAKEIFGIREDENPSTNEVLLYFKEGENRNMLANAIIEAKENGKPFDLQLELITAKGVNIWVRCIGKIAPSHTNETVLYGSIQDIDEIKKIEIEREKSNVLFKKLTESFPDVLFQAQTLDNGDSNMLLFSRNYLQIEGFDDMSPKVKGDVFIEHFHPDDLPYIRENLDKSLSTLCTLDIRARMILDIGEIRWIHMVATPEIIDDSFFWHGYFKDITESKASENELIRTKNLLLETNQVARVGGWERDLNTGKSIWSTVTKEIFEFDYQPSADEALQFYKEQYRAILSQHMAKCVSEGEAYDLELEIVTAKGREIWVRVIGKADFSNPLKKRVYGTVQDIDKLKKSEIAKEKTSQLLKNLAKQVPGGLCQYLLFNDGTFILPYVSEGFLNLFAVTSKAISESPNIVFDCIHPEDIKRVRKQFIESYNSLTIWQTNFRIILPSGEERWVSVESSPEHLENSVLWHGYFSDITQAKLIEIQLQHTKNILEETSRVARVGGWTIDPITRVIHWSNVIKEIIEVPYDFEPTLEIGLGFYKEGESRTLIQNSVRNCITLGTPFEIEVQVVSSRGEEIWVKAIGKAEIENGQVKRVYGICQDINQYKIAEENNKSLQKLELLLIKEKQLNAIKSRFLALASHEFRTPLAGILGSTELIEMNVDLLETSPPIEKVHKHIEHITTQVNRLTSMVKDVLTLEKTVDGKTILDLQPLAIKDFIIELTKEVEYYQKGNKPLKLFLPEAEQEILTDKNMLSHIINNLVSNAYKYSRKAELAPEIHVNYLEKYIRIEVKDYGIGIPEKDQQQLFETFFRASNAITTEGTGLGLSIAKEFAEKIGGKLRFVSEEGFGSSFILKIPYEI